MPKYIWTIKQLNSWTIKQLNSLKPGQSYIYYRGNFEIDIRQSETAAAEILAEVRDRALHLAQQGIVKLETRKAKQTHSIWGDDYTVIEYIAHRPPYW